LGKGYGGADGEALSEFVNNTLFQKLKKLATAAGRASQDKVVGAMFEDAYNYMKSGKLLMIQEFDREKQWWQKRKPNEYAWKVSAEAIAARNYNLDCKNPHEVAVNHRDPQELMAEYWEIDRQMKAAQDALKQELIGALGGS
jgi:type I restriction-modification system DNA methylase subunit